MGFSQGAMTALFTGLRLDPPCVAILAYAGALLAPQRLAVEIASLPPCCWCMARPMRWYPLLGPARRNRRCVRLEFPWRRRIVPDSAMVSMMPGSRLAHYVCNTPWPAVDDGTVKPRAATVALYCCGWHEGLVLMRRSYILLGLAHFIAPRGWLAASE